MPGFPILVAFAAKATVIFSGALLAARFLRRGSAACRHLVWAVALAAVAALPLVGWLLPILPLEVLPSLPSGDRAASATVVSRSGDLRSLIVPLWGLGAAMVLLRTAAGWGGVLQLRRRAVRLDDPAFARELRSLGERLEIGRPTTLLTTEDRVGPITWGLLRPKILLPAEARDWAEVRRGIVLTHELAHVARFDALPQAIAQVALALAWFHPLAWIAARREREERERACDDLVLRLGTRASRYAGELVGFARLAKGGVEAPRVVAAMARRSELEGRLFALLDPRAERGGVPRRAWAVLALCLVAVLPLTMAEPVATVPSLLAGTVDAPTGAEGRRAAGLDERPLSADESGRADVAARAPVRFEGRRALPPRAVVSERVPPPDRKPSAAEPVRLTPLSPSRGELATADRPLRTLGSLGSLEPPGKSLAPLRGRAASSLGGLSPLSPLHPSI